MKKIILFILFCWLQLHFFAQINVIEDIITYNSEFEKELFSSEEKSDNLNHLLSITKNIDNEKVQTIKTILSFFVQELKEDLTRFKTDAKRIKFIQSKIRSRFLKKYKLVSEFYNIFKNGDYNCVSSTALLAYVLDELNIPYSIKELPTHVYLIAYPQTSGIIVETTADKKATSTIKESTIIKSVNFLIENNLIEKQTITQEEYREIYNNYFFTSQSINMLELSALQYYNASLEYYDNKDFFQSLSSIQKAYSIYPSKIINYIKFQSLIKLLQNSEKENIEKIILISEYANIKYANKEAVINNWNQIVYNQLLKNDRKSFVDSAYLILNKTIKNKELKNELDVILYLGYSDYYDNKFNRKKSFEYAELAFKSDTNSTFTQSNYASKLFQNLGKYIFEIEDDFVSEELIDTLNFFKNKYTFLQKNNLFLALTFYTYSKLSSSFFLYNEGQLGIKYYDLAIKTVDLVEDKSIIQDYYYGMLYAEAGAYFYRQKKYTKAKTIIEEGLKIIPDHERLTIRLEIIESKIKN